MEAILKLPYSVYLQELTINDLLLGHTNNKHKAWLITQSHIFFYILVSNVQRTREL